jgi:hypothetical protein
MKCGSDLGQHDADNGAVENCHQQAKRNHQRGLPPVTEAHSLFPPQIFLRLASILAERLIFVKGWRNRFLGQA